jgi:hypothetical protein
VTILLVWRYLAHRPWRSALLFAGFGLGVGVMIVLLSIGDALLAQARDERLVGGGDVTVLPEGLDVEVMKTGGVGGLYFSIDNARFVHGQLLASPRLAADIRDVAPQIDGKLLYLRTRDGREIPVRAVGELPSATRAVGSMPALAAGAWEDDDLDRRWRAPTLAELRADIDRFHLPPAGARGDSSWGEWHYFNVLSADAKRWAFLSFIVGGAVPDGEWGGQLLLTLHEEGKPPRRYSRLVPRERVRFSTHDADLVFGDAYVRVRDDGRYEVQASLPSDAGGPGARVELVVTPGARTYFPGAAIGGDDFVSGYAVPGLRADADGSICVATSCERFVRAQAYHDHNWGVWRGVTWEWGAARAGDFAVLYGRVEPPDTVAVETPLFLYLVDSLGFRTLLRPRRVAYEDTRTILVDDRPVRVPARAVMADVRGRDTLRVELVIEDAVGTDTRRPLIERGDASAARRLARPYFIQMKGRLRIEGRVGGEPVRGEGYGFFETYR